VLHNSLALVNVQAAPPQTRETVAASPSKAKQPQLVLQRPQAGLKGVQFLWRDLAGGQGGTQLDNEGQDLGEIFVPLSRSGQGTGNQNSKSDDASKTDDDEFYWVISGLTVMNCTAAAASSDANGSESQPSKHEAQLLLLAHRVRPATLGDGQKKDGSEGAPTNQQIVTDNLKFDVIGTVLLVVKNAMDPPLQWQWYVVITWPSSARS
jgi:hypothetical protein